MFVSLVNDIIPYIESHYRAIPDRSARAISGLSMGGGHTTAASIAFPGTFDYILPLSAGMGGDAATIDPQLQKVKAAGYKLYWIGCGSADFTFASNQNLDAALTRNGMEHTSLYYRRRTYMGQLESLLEHFRPTTF